MKQRFARCVSIAAMLLATFASAGPTSVVIRNFDHLAMAQDGSRIADVEADDPENLPEEAHGQVTVRDATGKSLGSYDPCKPAGIDISG
jgi:hypothetical protein